MRGDRTGRGAADDTAVLVGRDRESQVLRAAVTRVASDVPGVVLLTGPPGVGKTRLAREALAIADAAGFATFTGRAHELVRDVAYAPLIEAFGPSLREMAGPARAALIEDLPQLGLVFAGIGLTPPEPLGDPALERTRLVDGFARLVERLARARPLALLLDDVHAAESATLALLHYLAFTVTDRPLLVVLTGRPDEAGRNALAALSTGLAESTWWVEPLAVDPLPDRESTALVESLLGTPLDDRLAGLVLDRCAGRPLFLQAMARALAESDRLVERSGVLSLFGDEMPLPDGVRDQLRARLAPVTPDERRLLYLMAVAGREVEHDLLVTAAADIGQPRLVDALVRLHDRGLSVGAPASGGGGYDLAHGLLRDTLLGELAPVAVSRIHAALAEALIELHPDDPRIPEHILGAGPLVAADQALAHLQRGGERASLLGATDEANRYLGAAVTIARDRGRTDLLADVLAGLARVRDRLGAKEEARALWQEACVQYARRGDPVGVAKVERELALLAWSNGQLDAARARFAAAERALDGLAVTPEHAELAYAVLITASRVGDVDAVARSARRLHELADTLGSASLSARTHLADAVLDYAATDYQAMVDKSTRGLAAALVSGDPALVMRGHDQLSVAAASQGDLTALREHSEASARVADRLGAPSLRGWPRIRLAYADLLAGDWDAALRGTAEGMTIARRFAEQRGAVSSIAAHALVLTHRGRLDDARGYVAEARAAAQPMLEGDRNIFSMVAIAAATLALAEGDPAGALRFSRQLDDLTGGWFPLFAASVLGEARARSGDVTGARETAEKIRGIRSCSTVLPAVLGDWLDGIAGAEAGHRRAGDALRAAAGGFESLGLPFHAARALLARARQLVDREPSTAADEAGRALTTFDRLGAPLEAQQARAVLRTLGKVPSRGRARRRTDGPLSQRELDVARLVAAGLSNADVATRLFISPRTVTTHLDHIYSRLGLTSRVALTRYLADSGLLDEPVDAPAVPAAPAARAAPATLRSTADTTRR